jgi:hypothetical protein
MNDSGELKLCVHRGVGSRTSDPTRLCCALTNLSRILASYVPQTETRMDLIRGLCHSQSFRVEEIGWRSGDGAS